jgi:CRP-like cAMP-binding protein
MYFLSKGDCVVNIKDTRGQEHSAVKLLTEGDYFGEIALIYSCPRTASVQSRNYNTMARISYHQYREIVNEFPEFLKVLKRHIQTYKDITQNFLQEMILRLPFVKHAPEIDIFTIFSLMYRMKVKKYEEDQAVIKETAQCSEIMFVQSGILEVYTEFEGNEFVIDRLHMGSIINFRSFFTEDNMWVNIRCRQSAVVSSIDSSLINELIYEDDKFNRSILQYTDILLNHNKRYPLDYIVCIPPYLLDGRISQAEHL